jgi:hypothetical protein
MFFPPKAVRIVGPGANPMTLINSYNASIVEGKSVFLIRIFLFSKRR